MFQTIYTFRILSFQNSARRAVLQILFITHSAKIISVHTAPPIAQMLRNLSSVLIPDIRAEAICVRRKWNTKPRNSGSGGFYKYVPNLHGRHWGSSFIYVCFCLLVPPGACSHVPTGAAACMGRTRQDGAESPSWGLSSSLSWEAARSKAKIMGFRFSHYLGQFFPPAWPYLSHPWNGDSIISYPQSCCDDSMKCSIDISSYIWGVFTE